MAESDPEFACCGEAMWSVGEVLIEDDGEVPEPGPREKTVETYKCYALATHPNEPSFNYHDGRIVVRGVDEAAFRKIFQVAEKLGAVVQGDEGEYYRLTDHGVETTQERPDPGSSTGSSRAG